MSRMFHISSLILALFTLASAAQPRWIVAAKHLIGETDLVRDRSIVELKKIPDLNQILEKELSGPNKAFALDVIVVLQKMEFLPQLLKGVESDVDGILTLATNGLLSVATKDQITSHYVKLLETQSSQLKPTVLMAIIDALARAGTTLSDSVRRDLFAHPFLEIRSAMLGFLRLQFFRNQRKPSVKELRVAINQKSLQLRRQAAFFLSELKAFPEYKPLFEICKHDQDLEIQKLCKESTESKK